MATTFYNSSRLPKELQYMIWECALRPDAPGVHFFKINDMSTFPAEGAVVRDVRLYTLIKMFNLTISVRSTFISMNQITIRKRYQAWWKDGNPSTYEVDSGLWTACKESRYVMEHAFGPCIWPCLRRNLNYPPETVKDETMISFHAVTNKEKGCYSLRPRQDLIVFQIERMPIFYPFNCYRGIDFLVHHELAPDHVGLEFDPVWAEAIIEYHKNPSLSDGVVVVTRLLGATQRCDNLWVIDYNLTRKFNVSRQEGPIERGLMKFQAGNRRFVEVRYDKEDAYKWRDWEKMRKSSSSCCPPAKLEALKLLSQNWTHWPDSRMYTWKKIGLLGWEQIWQRSCGWGIRCQELTGRVIKAGETILFYFAT
ncbi:hypothetical protein BKA59DRAFT_535187 [Fusarium tricinctum]|uniref:Uncharacterized protein n=1 Tax=Fusarium tricinctum TaxID=61284 RepID=A0A8K0RPD4_9HYPO|nr:hypothetical protein BKA59DRAFT_535187 [Fusarium tricinctum]